MSDQEDQKLWNDMVIRAKNLIGTASDNIKAHLVYRNSEVLIWADMRIEELEEAIPGIHRKYLNEIKTIEDKVEKLENRILSQIISRKSL